MSKTISISNPARRPKFVQEYLRSVKNIKAEEFMDAYFYRPMAFLIVKLFYRSSLTPNHYSFLAFIAGCLSAYYFTLPEAKGFVLAGFYFGLFSVLDCCDGMLARMKGNGTELGRIIDGMVDYSVNIFVYLGLGIGLSHSGFTPPAPISSWWMLVIPAGLSKAAHSMIYDYYLNEYLAYEKGIKGFLKAEIGKRKDKEKKAHNLFKKVALKVYQLFLNLQSWQGQEAKVYESQGYLRKNLTILRWWALIGPGVDVTLLIITAIFKIPMVYFFFCIVFANLLTLALYLVQQKINQGLMVEQSP